MKKEDFTTKCQLITPSNQTGTAFLTFPLEYRLTILKRIPGLNTRYIQISTDPLTEEAFEVLGAAVVGPVCVLQVPYGALMARQQVFDLQARGGIAARVRPEARSDFKASVCHRVVARAQPWPVAETLFPATLLQRGLEEKVKGQPEGLS